VLALSTRHSSNQPEEQTKTQHKTATEITNIYFSKKKGEGSVFGDPKKVIVNGSGTEKDNVRRIGLICAITTQHDAMQHCE
jgi:hypothetical protein